MKYLIFIRDEEISSNDFKIFKSIDLSIEPKKGEMLVVDGEYFNILNLATSSEGKEIMVSRSGRKRISKSGNT